MNPYDDEPTLKWMRQMPSSFVEWLDENFIQNLGLLRGATDLQQIGRFQGILNTLEFFQELRKRG